MGILFIGANIAHKLWIGNFVGSAGDFIFGDEVNGVGARNTAPDSLCEAAKFIGKGLIPDGFFHSLYQVAEFLERPGDGVSHRVCLCLVKECYCTCIS